MEEGPENGKESSHYARANGMNELLFDRFLKKNHGCAYAYDMVVFTADMCRFYLVYYSFNVAVSSFHCMV
jgi:hypothetical protein